MRAAHFNTPAILPVSGPTRCGGRARVEGSARVKVAGDAVGEPRAMHSVPDTLLDGVRFQRVGGEPMTVVTRPRRRRGA